MTKSGTAPTASDGRQPCEVRREGEELTRYTSIGIAAVAAAVRCQRMPAPQAQEWSKTELDLWDHVVQHDDDPA